MRCEFQSVSRSGTESSLLRVKDARKQAQEPQKGLGRSGAVVVTRSGFEKATSGQVPAPRHVGAVAGALWTDRRRSAARLSSPKSVDGAANVCITYKANVLCSWRRCFSLRAFVSTVVIVLFSGQLG